MTKDPRCPITDIPADACFHCDPTPRRPWPRRKDLDNAGRPGEDIASTITTRDVPPIHAKDVIQMAESLLDYVIDLCDWTRRSEPYQVQRRNSDGTHTFITLRHITTTAPLLHQLGAALSTSGAEDGGGINAFESKSPARDDAIATLMTIEQDAYAWLADLEHVNVTKVHQQWPTLIEAVRHLGSLAVPRLCTRRRGRRDKNTKDWCCTGHNVEGDLRTWHTQARITTGWDSPAWRPANTCPLCGNKGSLRVRREEKSGMCVKCRETWTPESIGLLADHIRAENDDPFFTPDVAVDTPAAREGLA